MEGRKKSPSVYHSLISPYVNFRNNRKLWTIFLLANCHPELTCVWLQAYLFLLSIFWLITVSWFYTACNRLYRSVIPEETFAKKQYWIKQSKFFMNWQSWINNPRYGMSCCVICKWPKIVSAELNSNKIMVWLQKQFSKNSQLSFIEDIIAASALVNWML